MSEWIKIEPQDPGNYSPVFVQQSSDGRSIVIADSAFGDVCLERMVVMESGQFRAIATKLESYGPMSTVPTYVRVDGPPDDWHMYSVIDLDTRLEVSDVVEVDSEAGWVRRYTGRVVASVEGDEAETEVVRGRFMVTRRAHRS